MRTATGPFSVRLIHANGTATVTVRGEVDLANADRFESVMHKATTGARRVVVDLGETTFMDSTGLSILIRAGQHLGRPPEAFVVRRPNDLVHRLLHITGVDSLVTIEGCDHASVQPDA